MKKPVVVYAASGYTGRLACEALTKLGVPFIAAGRNQQKLEAVANEMRAQGADCEAIAVEHTPAGLRQLFRGTKVVINISGPFSLLGNAVVEAALDSGVHYLDSTGEQQFMYGLHRDFGERFAQQKLVLSPSASFLWALGAAGAEVCLETAGIDSLKMVYAPPSLQTVASLQSVVRETRRPAVSILNGKNIFTDTTEVHRVPVPGRGEGKALRVGAAEATFYDGDKRVRSCETFFANDRLCAASKVFWAWNHLTNRVLIKKFSAETLDSWSDAAVLKLKKDPPLEDINNSAFVVTAVGTGGGKRVQVTMNGVACYALTGFIAAVGAQEILNGSAKRFGYASLAQAIGARALLKRLEEFGTYTQVEVTGGASKTANAQMEQRA